MPVSGLNEIHKVQAGDLTFVDIPKYYKKSFNSAATVILINQDVEFPAGKAILISENPFTDYNRLVTHFKPLETPSDYNKNGLYTTGKEVSIGKDTDIYPGVVIGSRVTIGNNCTIYPNVTIYEDTIIGDNVIIQANCVIGGHAFYFKNRKTHFEKLLSCGRVVIEDDVEMGASCTIDKGVSGDTVIGKGTKMDNHIHVGHGAIIGQRCLIAAQVGIGGKAIIEDEVTIWGQAGLTKDITIGKGAVISAQSGVSKSLPGGKTYFGTPAQEIFTAQRELAALRGLRKK